LLNITSVTPAQFSAKYQFNYFTDNNKTESINTSRTNGPDTEAIIHNTSDNPITFKDIQSSNMHKNKKTIKNITTETQ